VSVNSPPVGAGAAMDGPLTAALGLVTDAEWAAWFPGVDGRNAPRTITLTVVATFAIPQSRGTAAICLVEGRAADEGVVFLGQAALKRWTGDAPTGAQVLHREGQTDAPVWTLASAWSDAEVCIWLRDALSAGVSLRAGGWEWLASPERPAAGRVSGGAPRSIGGRRHDVVLFEPAAVAIAYTRLIPGGQPELDLLRHLERVPGVRIAPTMLGSAIIISPSGQRSACAVLEDIIPAAATVRSVLVGRLRRALDGDPSLQAVALDDVRAVGVIARELHAALGRPLGEGVIAGARTASAADLDSWVARTWTTLSDATLALRDSAGPPAELLNALSILPGKLQQFAAAAERAPGLVHRIHGNLRLDTVLMSPPRALSVVEFDGDALLPDAERVAPQSPWRDVARLLVSLAESAAEAALLAGGDDKAFEIAWLWEREARKACLEGYGTGGGALHALLAISEMEFAARALLDAVASRGSTVVASHILQRLTRTIV
jgi:predicted trehalose synthase